MICEKCGEKHEDVEMNLEIEDDEDSESKSKLDILRELIEETKGHDGKRIASGGAVVRPLPIPKPRPTPTPRPEAQKVAFTDEEEDSDFDAEDFRSRFKRKV